MNTTPPITSPITPARVRNLASEEGQAAVEFAMVLPLLVVLLLGVIQLGIAFNNYVTLTDAARAGARKAIVSRLAGGGTSDAEAAVRAAAGSLDQAKLQVDTTNAGCTTSGAQATLVAKYPYSINLLGWVAKSGFLTSTMKERCE
jgi:Flp pilus assembly protein TadG